MRVLFATEPGYTLFQFMVPLAWALRAAGHEVRVASQPDFAPLVAETGLTAVPVGRNFVAGPVSPDEPDDVLAAPYDVADHPERATWEHLRAGYRQQLDEFYKPVNFPVIGGLVEFARRWRPDLVFWEPGCYAGAIAAHVVGAAHARVLWSRDVFGVAREHYLRLRDQRPADDREDPLAEWLAFYAERHGVDYAEDMACGHFTVTAFPESLRIQADRLTYLPVRHVPYGGRATVRPWLWRTSGRRRIALTLGSSVVHEHPGGHVLDVRDVLAALADLDVEVVATIAEREQPKLGRVPDNATVVPFAPLDDLVPTCAAVIHHAGPGTLATTSLHGVPQLALPWEFDEPAVAELLARQGAALTTHATRATGDTVRRDVLRLLDEPSFTAAAGRLRAEMLSMPTPAEVVRDLEELTDRHRAAPAGRR
ncbi:activator-dependent family glycosyltransferase [Saccharothrix australiensis]|uniref:Glycosyltransferase (Activator-dependent family) n=1 Tax=Saccharothrix australiensis TaxID=2072 RepID=A0A495VZ23_9PSEU|nr:activator-dependent family glycosyltransferase [Saccharothrix australiensis]RKT54692.1 glycosyltransferase (activator-dependent family) [Saccharothrix australiensis]